MKQTSEHSREKKEIEGEKDASGGTIPKDSARNLRRGGIDRAIGEPARCE